MKKKLTILYLGSNGFPFGSAAIQRQIQLSKIAIQAGFNVVVINRQPAHPKEITKREKIFFSGSFEGIKYLYCSIFPFRSRRFFTRNFVKIIGVILEFAIIIYFRIFKNARYIFNNSIELKKLKYYYYLSRFLKMKLVYDYVEFIGSLSDRSKKNIKEINNSFDFHFYKYTDIIIVISEFLRNHLLEMESKKIIIKIPPVIDFSYFENILVKNANEKYFLFCGSASYRDIIDFVIKAFEDSEALKNNFHLKLIINGDYIQLKEINSFLRMQKTSDNIELLSKLPYFDLIKSYKLASALLIPISDNLQDQARFPFKICEYTASKRPIITSDSQSINEYFTNDLNALIVKQNDREDFIQKLNFVMNCNNKFFIDEIGENGYNLGKSVFNFKSYVNQLAIVLNRTKDKVKLEK